MAYCCSTKREIISRWISGRFDYPVVMSPCYGSQDYLRRRRSAHEKCPRRARRSWRPGIVLSCSTIPDVSDGNDKRSRREIVRTGCWVFLVESGPAEDLDARVGVLPARPLLTQRRIEGRKERMGDEQTRRRGRRGTWQSRRHTCCAGPGPSKKPLARPCSGPTRPQWPLFLYLKPSERK